jgi:hypothetical protein
MSDMNMVQAEGEMRTAAHKSVTNSEMEALIHRARARGRNKDDEADED